MNIFDDLVRLARERKANPVDGSYTNKLLSDKTLIKSKVLEEINEIIEGVKKKKNTSFCFRKTINEKNNGFYRKQGRLWIA